MSHEGRRLLCPLVDGVLVLVPSLLEYTSDPGHVIEDQDSIVNGIVTDDQGRRARDRTDRMMNRVVFGGHREGDNKDTVEVQES